MLLYHRTSKLAADEIIANRSWRSRENTQEVYFSSIPDGQTEGYGAVVVCVDVPESVAELEDEFPDGEQHFRVAVSDLAGLPVSLHR
ncbi:hypothetical protein [Rhodococcus pyridinivorans]|uniref:hypothetical protein n=1 Tax=Rhodococcus pyridinivorans TaxID=103816 RepID=UPI00265829E0|nr:hypothetical protein [Rhodococcus pyridinivorans]